MKNLFFIAIAFCIFSGTSFQSFAQPAPRLIKGMAFKRVAVSSAANTSQASVIEATEVSSTEIIPVRQRVTQTVAMATESCTRLQFKFAQLLEREVETITHLSLFSFIDEWWATHYRYGGTTKAGIDCSAFVGLLMTTVYGLSLPRTAGEQYAASEKISREDMLEGDMVFFNIRGGISHVGLYLGGGYFVHASVSSGVTINNLEEGYYARKFAGAGRAKDNAVTRDLCASR